MIVFCIEGSGASSTGDQPLTNAVYESLQVSAGVYTFYPSRFRWKCDDMVMIASKSGSKTYLIVAKSKGAYELYQHLSDLSPILDCADCRVAIVTVDPHASFWRCGPGHPTGAMRMLDTPSVKAWNVYQRCRYPRGAVVIGAKNTVINRTTHSQIVRSANAIKIYREAVEWLKGEV